MEIRRSKRQVVSLSGEVISEGVCRPCFIGNLSEEGLFIRVSSSKKDIELNPGDSVELTFQTPSGEAISLQCRIKWVNKRVPGSLYYNIGMHLCEIPRQYRDFVTGRVQF